MKPIKELVYNQSREVNASFTMAGAACLLYIACGLFCPEDYGGYLHIKAFWYLGNLVVPMLYFWVGMLLRWKFEQPKEWQVAVIETTWFRIIAWDAPQIKKGDAVHVLGRLRERRYTGADGIEQRLFEVIASLVKRIGG